MAPYMKGVSNLDPNQQDAADVRVTKIWFCPSQGMNQPGTHSDATNWGWLQLNYSYFAGFDTALLNT